MVGKPSEMEEEYFARMEFERKRKKKNRRKWQKGKRKS